MLDAIRNHATMPGTALMGAEKRGATHERSHSLGADKAEAAPTSTDNAAILMHPRATGVSRNSENWPGLAQWSSPSDLAELDIRATPCTAFAMKNVVPLPLKAPTQTSIKRPLIGRFFHASISVLLTNHLPHFAQSTLDRLGFL